MYSWDSWRLLPFDQWVFDKSRGQEPAASGNACKSVFNPYINQKEKIKKTNPWSKTPCASVIIRERFFDLRSVAAGSQNELWCKASPWGCEGKCEGRKFTLTLTLTTETPINRAFQANCEGVRVEKEKSFFRSRELTSWQGILNSIIINRRSRQFFIGFPSGRRTSFLHSSLRSVSLQLQSLNQKTLTDYHRCNGVFYTDSFFDFFFLIYLLIFFLIVPCRTRRISDGFCKCVCTCFAEKYICLQD